MVSSASSTRTTRRRTTTTNFLLIVRLLTCTSCISSYAFMLQPMHTILWHPIMITQRLSLVEQQQHQHQQHQSGSCTFGPLWAAVSDDNDNNDNNSKKKKVFELMVDLPPRNSGLSAQMKIESVLPNDCPSEMIEVRYQLPFGLDIQPQNQLAVVTKDGNHNNNNKNGGGGDGDGGGNKEKVGDILRYTSQWTLGLPMGKNGLVTTASSFAGAIQWQCTLFDVTKAVTWEQVVEALVSNVPDRTDEVVLIFERPLPPSL